MNDSQNRSSPDSANDLMALADAVTHARDAYLNAYMSDMPDVVEKRRALEDVLWNDKGTFGPALRELAHRRTHVKAAGDPVGESISRDEVLRRISVFRDHEPESDETWESWYFSAFDLLRMEVAKMNIVAPPQTPCTVHNTVNERCTRCGETILRISAVTSPQPAPDLAEVSCLLKKISDLAFDEDVGEPLDAAIDYANKALAVLAQSSPPVLLDSHNSGEGDPSDMPGWAGGEAVFKECAEIAEGHVGLNDPFYDAACRDIASAINLRASNRKVMDALADAQLAASSDTVKHMWAQVDQARADGTFSTSPAPAAPQTARIEGADGIVDEAACLIWAELCPGMVMCDDDRPHYENAAKAVLALSRAPLNPIEKTDGDQS